MKLKIKEALLEANDVKQQVREFVENRINDTLDNLSQVVASKIPGYNSDWCDSDGRSAVANKLVQNIDSLVDAIVAVLFSEIGELNEATERENKDKPLTESIEDTKTIKDALNKTITGVNDNGLGSTGAFASWIAYGFDLDTMNIVDIAVAMDFDVYETNMGYFGTPDYLIMFPGKPITSYPDFNEDFIEDDFKKIN